MGDGSKNSLGYKMENYTILEMSESYSLCIKMVMGDLCFLTGLSQVKLLV